MTFRSRISSSWSALTGSIRTNHGEERAAPTRRPRPDAWDDFWFGPGAAGSASGIDVTAENALGFSAVWACVKVISEDLSSLPLIVYRRDGDNKERDTDSPIYGLLHDAPNAEMTAMQFREVLQRHLLLWGNCYAEIQRDLRGEVMALWPLNPARMTPSRDVDSRLYYEYRLSDGVLKTFTKENILHIAGPGWNGLVGQSVIATHAETFGIGLISQEYQATNLKNGGRLQLVFEHPAPVAPNKPDREEFRESLRREYGGRKGNAIGVLWEGMKASTVSMSLEDAQFVERMALGIEEVCRIFRVTPHKIMDLAHATFSNIEQQAIDYVVDAIRPWAVRWEQAINMRLLRPGQFCEHLVDGLLRGDLPSRYAAYAIGRNWGWLSANDIRRLENMNPISKGNIYLTPLNMVEAGTPAAAPAPVAVPAPTPNGVINA